MSGSSFLTYFSTKFGTISYKINQRYLSVFKVVFSNETDNIIKISIDSFQIISGNEQLNPLKTDYYEKNLIGSSEKLKNVFRMNMADNTTLVPHQSITKYFAVPTVDLNEEQLVVKLIFSNTVYDFDFKATREQIRKVFDFKEYKIIGKEHIYKTFPDYIVVKQNNRTYSLRSDKIYILSEQKSDPVSIYCMYFDGTRNKYGKIIDIKSSEIPKKKIKVPLRSFRTIEKSPTANFN